MFKSSKAFSLKACQGAMMDEGVKVVKKGRATETDSFASYKVKFKDISF